MHWFSFILYPFACIFNWITCLRNFLYDSGLLRSRSFGNLLISVGNLRVGGTGKTPFVEYLIREFASDTNRTATLSRGYGRATSGFIQASSISDSSEIGDESLQYFRKFKDNLFVFVGEDRVRAVEKIISIVPNINMIILDDAMQHRSIRPKVSILLTEYSRPFYEDFLLPMGRLRESRDGAKRAQFIIVTKCPENIQEYEMESIKNAVLKYSDKSSRIYYTYISYGEIQTLTVAAQNSPIGEEVVLLAGIDNPTPFVKHCSTFFRVKDKLIFRDHYDFSEADIEAIMQSSLPILTTEKDASRLLKFKSILNATPIYYLPIKIAFINKEDDFKECLWESINA